MRTARLAILLFCVALSAGAALVPGPERAIQPGTTSGVGGEPAAMASDGTDFLTLWQDGRAGRRGVYATIVSEDGISRPLAPRPLLITSGGGRTAAVWTGSSYLVLLTAVDNRTTVLHLDRDAQLLGTPEPLGSDAIYAGGLAWNGHVALVAVADPSWNRTLVFLDASGHITRSAIASLTGSSESAIVTAGDAFIVILSKTLEPPSDGGGMPLMTITAIRVSATGVAGPEFELVPPVRKWLAVGAAGGSHDAGVAVTANDYVSHTLSRFTIDGTTSAVEADPVIEIDPFGYSASVVRTPTGFAALYFYYANNHPTIQLGRISFGSTLRRTVALKNGSVSWAAIATNGRLALLITAGYPLSAARLDAAITTQQGDTVQIATSPSQQTTPVIAIAGDVALYAWTDAEALTVALFDRNGNALSAPVTLPGAPPSNVKPAVVFTGKVWLVAWQTDSFIDTNVLVQRISTSGALLGAPIDAGPGTEPVLASNGTVAVLVTAGPRGNTGIDVHRFSPDGELLDTTTNVAFIDRTNRPSIATNGSAFLLTWTQNPFYPGPWGIFGRRLTAEGIPIEAAAIPLVLNVALQHDGGTVASNGSDFVLAYLEYVPYPRTSSSMVGEYDPMYRTYAKRILSSGVLAEHTADQNGWLLGEGADPEITSTADGYLVTFTRTEIIDTDYVESMALFAVPTDARGEALAQPRVMLRTTTLSALYSLAVVDGTPWIAYSRLSAEDVGAQRVFARPLGDEAARRRTSRR